MAEYRRFVAYVYEYQKGKKADNCGFIKVEAWAELCRMEIHLRCPGLIAGAGCTVYGFVRKKGLLEGSRIGSGRTGNGRLDCLMETKTMAVGDGEIPLKEINGMVLLLDNGGFFGTEWDDQPIRPEDFHAMTKKAENEKTVPDNSGEDEEKEIPESESPQKEPEQKERTAEPEIHTQSVQETETAEDPKRLIPPPPPQSSGHAPHGKGPDRPKPAGTPCDPFNDGELTDCRKIALEELCLLGRRSCMLRNNRFLQYGYYNFGHLLLCRNCAGRWILGVPGGYDQQERFMANMFGFPYFKESGTVRIPKGKGGYWYRLIDAPDSDV